MRRSSKETQNWLSKQQSSDGSFEPDSREVYYGPKCRGRNEMHTAYVAWAMLESGCRGETTDKATAYLKTKLDSTDDPYTLALMANALGLNNSKDPDTGKALEKLIKTAHVDDDKAYWQCTTTATYGSG
ncbi:MAG: hypothetical protein AB2L14_36680 [Candidatus Xenobiia bacterium LiM19]